MKKTVVVKKNKGRRNGVLFLAIALSIWILILCLQNAYMEFAVLCVLIALAVSVILLYFETWMVSFSSDRITKKVFFLTVVNVSYAQIMDVEVAHSCTEYIHVRINTLNGKRVIFRMDDENANKALRRITSHCSVRRV